MPFRRLGLSATDAIGREEFVLMLLRRAGQWKQVGDAVKAITTKEPQALLGAVAAAMLKEEAAHPEDAAHV